MKPYKQTILHSESTIGNCWATCLACILELEAIPELNVMDNNWWEQSEAIANRVGKTLIEFPWNGGRFSRQVCIISGDSPRGKFKHAVVGYVESTGRSAQVEFLHDPHPSNNFITTVDYITLAIQRTNL